MASMLIRSVRRAALGQRCSIACRVSRSAPVECAARRTDRIEISPECE